MDDFCGHGGGEACAHGGEGVVKEDGVWEGGVVVAGEPDFVDAVVEGDHAVFFEGFADV